MCALFWAFAKRPYATDVSIFSQARRTSLRRSVFQPYFSGLRVVTEEVEHYDFDISKDHLRPLEDIRIPVEEPPGVSEK